MSGFLNLRRWRKLTARLRADGCGSQIVEFALSLPLLVLFVVGIFDFSSALSLKQKLTNAAREAARVAAADPANDLSGTALPMPVSVRDALQVADGYLVSEKINDCQLTSVFPTPVGLTWTFSAPGNSGNGCPTVGITFVVNRGYYFRATGGAPSSSCSSAQLPTGQTAIIGTCVTIQYPYQWQFTGASGLFGGTFLGPSVITTTAVAFNEN
jgi:Flp pilus assembly protein TadG